MLISFVYVVLHRVLQLIVLCGQSREFKELEIVVLRHQLGSCGGKRVESGAHRYS